MKITTCRFHVSATRPQDFPRDGRPQIAFMGRSNVGKSSLLNRLLGARGLARTSKDPGRTRAINFFSVNERLYFVDLPGYGYARVPDVVREQWRGIVDAYVAEPGCPDLAIHLVDSRHEPTDADRDLDAWLDGLGVRCLTVLTKIDKLSGNEKSRVLREAARRAGGHAPLAVSASTGDGIPALWRVIDEVCESETLRAAAGDGPGARAVIQGGRTIP